MGNNYVLYKYKYVFIIFFLILGFLIHFGPFLSFDYYFGPSQDNINWLQPFFSMQSRIFQNGELPLWNPNGFEEFYSDPFHSIFYPFYFIFFDLYETPLSSMKMIYSIALFHLLLTIFAMYYLLKQLNLSNFSSVFGGIIISYYTYLSMQLTWLTMTTYIPWMILSLALIKKIFSNNENSLVYYLFYILTVTLAIESGKQSIIFIFYFSLFFMVFLYFLKGLILTRKKILWLIFSFAVVFLINFHTFGTYIIHSGEYLRWIEINGNLITLTGRERLPFDSLILNQSSITDLINIILPIDDNNSFKSYYIGLFPIFFMLLGLNSNKNKIFKIFSLFLVFFGIFAICGKNLGFTYIQEYLPGLNGIRHPWLFSLFLLLGVNVLCAYSLDYVFFEKNENKNKYILIMFVLYIIVSIILYYIYPNKNILFCLVYGFIAFLIILIFSFYNLFNHIKFRVLLIIIFVFLFSLIQKTHSINQPDKIYSSIYFDKDFLIAHQIFSRLDKFDEISNSKIITYFPNSNVSYRQFDSIANYYKNVRVFRNYGSPLLKEEFESYNWNFNMPNYYEIHGAKYIVTTENLNLKKIFSENNYNVYETNHSMPYYGIYTKVKCYQNNISEIRDYNFLDEILIRCNDIKNGLKLDYNNIPDKNVIKIEKNDYNYKQFSIISSTDGIFFLNEHFKNEWKVYVNGSEEKIIKVNMNQIGVPIKEGKNMIVFDFYPRDYMWSIYLASILLGGILIMIFFIFVSKIYKSKQEEISNNDNRITRI